MGGHRRHENEGVIKDKQVRSRAQTAISKSGVMLKKAKDMMLKTRELCMQAALNAKTTRSIALIPAHRVACLGDSNTKEDGVCSYTRKLELLCCKDFDVKAFGLPRASLTETPGKLHFEASEMYASALKSRAHTYVLMLGTNDAWSPRCKLDEVPAALCKMVKQVKRISEEARKADGAGSFNKTSPDVIVVKPPGLRSRSLKRVKIMHHQLEATAKKANFTLVMPRFTRSSFRGDGIHLNAEGATVLARAVHRALLTQ